MLCQLERQWGTSGTSSSPNCVTRRLNERHCKEITAFLKEHDITLASAAESVQSSWMSVRWKRSAAVANVLPSEFLCRRTRAKAGPARQLLIAQAQLFFSVERKAYLSQASRGIKMAASGWSFFSRRSQEQVSAFRHRPTAQPSSSPPTFLSALWMDDHQRPTRPFHNQHVPEGRTDNKPDFYAHAIPPRITAANRPPFVCSLPLAPDAMVRRARR